MASSKLTGPRLEGQWINIMYNEEGNIVPYKARVDQYVAARNRYRVTWCESGDRDWVEDLLEDDYEMAQPPRTVTGHRNGRKSTRRRSTDDAPSTVDEPAAPRADLTGPCLQALPAHVLADIATAVLFEESAGIIAGADASHGARLLLHGLCDAVCDHPVCEQVWAGCC